MVNVVIYITTWSLAYFHFHLYLNSSATRNWVNSLIMALFENVKKINSPRVSHNPEISLVIRASLIYYSRAKKTAAKMTCYLSWDREQLQLIIIVSE